MYKTVEEYVRDHGYELSDLTPDEIEAVKKEVADINAGHDILDGVFSGLRGPRIIPD